VLLTVSADQLADSMRAVLVLVRSITICRSRGDRYMKNATRARNAIIMNGKRIERFMYSLLQAW